MPDNNGKIPVEWETRLSRISHGTTAMEFRAKCAVFQQGHPADSIFYLRQGKVALSVTSTRGQEAIVATLSSGDFLGEGCLANQPLRMSTATAISDCSLYRIEKTLMARMLHDSHEISEMFVSHMLGRHVRLEADLLDHLFNAGEKRLARILLLQSRIGREGGPKVVLTQVSQRILTQMVVTTCLRVSHFMNKFRKLGFIDCRKNKGLTVQRSLLSVILHE
jgi:CRP/FNR family transcriptional regulator, cyclic AMP receptor protein